MKKQLEIITYTHKGVEVTVKIDYRRKNIGLLDTIQNPKTWVFANQTAGGAKAWLDIMDAMKYATEKGLALLEEDKQRSKPSVITDEIDYLSEANIGSTTSDRPLSGIGCRVTDKTLNNEKE